jgi:hypothetical protein
MEWQAIFVALLEFITLMLCGYLLGRFGWAPYERLREVNQAVKIMEHRRLIKEAFKAGYRYREKIEQEQRDAELN